VTKAIVAALEADGRGYQEVSCSPNERLCLLSRPTFLLVWRIQKLKDADSLKRKRLSMLLTVAVLSAFGNVEPTNIRTILPSALTFPQFNGYSKSSDTSLTCRDASAADGSCNSGVEAERRNVGSDAGANNSQIRKQLAR